MDKSVLTVGTFDIPHMGHVSLLIRCASLGRLTVGLNSDRYIETYKGALPIFTYEERANLLSMLPFVKGVVPNFEDSLRPMLELVKPDILVIGSDWSDRYFEQIKLTRRDLEDMGVMMIYLPYTKEISTSMIKKRVYERK